MDNAATDTMASPSPSAAAAPAPVAARQHRNPRRPPRSPSVAPLRDQRPRRRSRGIWFVRGRDYDIFVACCKAVLIFAVFYFGVLPMLFNKWRNASVPIEHDDAQLSMLLAQPTNANGTTITTSPLFNASSASSSHEIDLEEEDDEDYDDEEEEEEEIDITTSTNMSEQDVRPPRTIEEEVVLVHLPDPYANDEDEMAYTLEDLQNALEQLRTGLFQPIEQQLQVVEEQIQVLLNRRTTLTSTTDVKTVVPVEALRELLSVVSLSDLPDEAVVEDMFWKARDELHWIMNNNYTVPWNLVEAVLNRDYPRVKLDEDDMPILVPEETGCKIPLLSDVNQSLARRDTDLARHVADVERWLQGLSQDILQASALRSRQRQWEQSISELAAHAKTERNAILAHEIQEKNRGQNCITREQVLDMVDEGLLVLQQHQQPQQHNVQALRAVLEEKTKALEPDTQVILDAIFLPPPQQPQQQQRKRSSSWLTSTLTTSSSINLRQFLDTPLLSQQVPQWLDGFEKSIGGHLDVVDDVLDWLVQQPPPPTLSAAATTTTETSSSSSSNANKITVGHLVVAHLLELAGKVNITLPNVLRELPRRRQEQYGM